MKLSGEGRGRKYRGGTVHGIDYDGVGKVKGAGEEGGGVLGIH